MFFSSRSWEEKSHNMCRESNPIPSLLTGKKNTQIPDSWNVCCCCCCWLFSVGWLWHVGGLCFFCWLLYTCFLKLGWNCAYWSWKIQIVNLFLVGVWSRQHTLFCIKPPLKILEICPPKKTVGFFCFFGKNCLGRLVEFLLAKNKVGSEGATQFGLQWLWQSDTGVTNGNFRELLFWSFFDILIRENYKDIRCTQGILEHLVFEYIYIYIIHDSSNMLQMQKNISFFFVGTIFCCWCRTVAVLFGSISGVSQFQEIFGTMRTHNLHFQGGLPMSLWLKGVGSILG